MYEIKNSLGCWVKYSGKCDHIPKVGDILDEIDGYSAEIVSVDKKPFSDSLYEYNYVPYIIFDCEFRISEEDCDYDELSSEERLEVRKAKIWVNEYDYYGSLKESGLEKDRFEAYCYDFGFSDNEGNPFWCKFGRDNRDITKSEFEKMAKQLSENTLFADYVKQQDEYNEDYLDLIAQNAIYDYLGDKFPHTSYADIRGFVDNYFVDINYSLSDLWEKSIEIINEKTKSKSKGMSL